MNDENEHITDVEDMNDDARRKAGAPDEESVDEQPEEEDVHLDSSDEEVSDTDQDDEMTSDNSLVLHGEIMPPEKVERALAIIGEASADAEAFYQTFDEKTARDLRNAAVEAKLKMYDSRDSALEAGRILHNVQVQLGHSRYGKWLEVEFSGSRKTAQNFVALAMVADDTLEHYGTDAQLKILSLPATALYEAGTDNLKKADRLDVIERYVHGDLADKKEFLSEVKRLKALEKERKDAEKVASGKVGKPKKESDGEGDGTKPLAAKPLTFKEQVKAHHDALRMEAIWDIAASIARGESEAERIVGIYGEIGTGRKGVPTPEDHQAVSEMLLKVMQKFLEDPEGGVEKLKPNIPDLPVPKAKKGKSAEGDD